MANLKNLKEMAEIAATTGMKLVVNGDEISLEPVNSNIAASVHTPSNVQILEPLKPVQAYECQ